MYADILISKLAQKIDRLFTYKVPEGLKDQVLVGQQVLVPFGKSLKTGYITGLSAKLNYEIPGIKELAEIRSDIRFFGEEHVKLADWMSQYYAAPFGACMRSMLPSWLSPYENPSARKRLFSDSSCNWGTSGQVKAPSAVLLFKGTRALLDDYKRMIRENLRLNRGTILLLPEISRNNMIFKELRQEFGEDIVLVHAKTPEKDKMEGWRKLCSGRSRIAVGTRNAIFAPVRDLATVIVHEEEGYAYKQEQMPRYHAREVVLRMSEVFGFEVVLGSSCPTLETYFNAVNGRYRLEKAEAAGDGPKAEIIDMNVEPRSGAGLFADKTVNGADHAIRSGKKALLIINRRGYATYITCMDCGHIVECPNCSISLSYHTFDKALHCNRCGYRSDKGLVCPKCMSSRVNYGGTGTQKAESEAVKFFPHARILRLDRDIKTEAEKRKVLEVLNSGQYDIVIGTQMVLSAVNPADVGFVSILDADTSLNMPDFRASEGTMRLLFRACGHYSAGADHGCTIQTRNPTHYAIVAGKRGDYRGFYDKEIGFREQAGFPPFSRMALVVMYGADSAYVEKACRSAAEALRADRNGAEISGPAQSGLSKVRGQAVWKILIRSEDLDMIKKSISAAVSEVLSEAEKAKQPLRVSVDIDPMEMV